MSDIPVKTQLKGDIGAAVVRGIRVAIAIGLPYLISYIAGHPDVKWSGLAPILMAMGKYLRDAYGWELTV